MSSNRVALRAYRALLTQTRAIRDRGTDTLTVRLPVEGSWGHGQTYHGSEKHRRSVERYLGDLAQTSQPAFLMTGAAESVRSCRHLSAMHASSMHVWMHACRDAWQPLLRCSLGTSIVIMSRAHSSGGVLQSADPRCAILLDTLSNTIRDRFRSVRRIHSMLRRAGVWVQTRHRACCRPFLDIVQTLCRW